MRDSVKIGLILMVLFFLKVRESCYAQKFSKNEIKAAYVHNIIKFVQWPENKTEIRLGIVGDNDFTSVLKSKLVNQKIGEYVVRIVHYSAKNKIKNCDVVFIANDDKIDCKLILKKLKNKSILTIGESELFFNNNGMINLEGRNGGEVFLINNSTAIEEEIMISPKLLKLASKIR